MVEERVLQGSRDITFGNRVKQRDADEKKVNSRFVTLGLTPWDKSKIFSTRKK